MGRPQCERWQQGLDGHASTKWLKAFLVVGVAALFFCGGSGAAEKTADEPESIFTAARAAVANGRIEKSLIHGYNDEHHAFTELPADGAVLVGLDCGVGKFGDIDTVYALRSIYRTPRGDVSYREHGRFANRWSGNHQIKSRVLRTVRIVARPGYAVGGATLRVGMNINGLGLTFMRIKGRLLDPFRSYRSEWVGDRTGGSEIELDGDGAPVVGLYGCQDEEHVFALGLYLMLLPARAAERPRVEQRPVARRVDAPKVEKPPDDAKKAGENGAGEQAEERKASAKTMPVARAMNWVPFAVFGVVALPILVFLVSVSRKGHVQDRRRGEIDPAQKAAGAPAGPPCLTATGIQRPDPGHIRAGGDLPDATLPPPSPWGQPYARTPSVPPPPWAPGYPQRPPAASQPWDARDVPAWPGQKRKSLPRPWWVETGLKGIHSRGAAWAFFWVSIALTFGPGIVGAALGKPYFMCGLFAFAALWYWLCIRWVDQNGTWE